MKIVTALISHDDAFYLAETIRCLEQFVSTASIATSSDSESSSQSPLSLFLFLSRLPWHSKPGDWQSVAEAAESLGLTTIVGDWSNELAQRQAAIEHLKSLGFTHALIPDTDEIIEPQLLETLVKIAENELADRVYVHWDTYWKSPQYVIRPREPFTPCYLIDLRVAKPVGARNFEGGRPLLLGPEYGIVHHLSWVGPQRRIDRKTETWGHAKEVLPGWKEHVWKAWDNDKTLRNLHPTHPPAYGFAERIALPDILQPSWERYKQLSGYIEPELLSPTSPWPSLSIVIPVYGGEDDLAACLASLSPLHSEGLLHEVLVVDDASPDEEAIASVCAEHPFAKLLRQPTNGGFSATCNAGANAATGELLLFLNSDTVVPRAGLLRLVESLLSSGPLCAAAGPYTNHSGHLQQIQVNYTTLDTMPLFAEDFASQGEIDAPDLDVDMLVGFCLLVRASAFKSLGGFDTRFGIGTFEDNDLCYRLRREGFRLTLAGRAFVHHEGSKSLTKAVSNAQSLLQRNHGIYLDKWRADLQSGFVSHLSGLPASATDRILFDPARKPEERQRQARQRARQADISLVMIVKNEERVLGPCLASAMPYFSQTIVVDTGSTDKTVEIAKATGATVESFPWTNSFSEARNESLRHATGKWVFWLDADDTIEPAAGEALLDAALSAPPDVVAFVVPVQFLDESGQPSATRVDHVKLFRNLPGLAFEGRIHEQILPSLRSIAGPAAQVARAPQAARVLHSGYDTSDEGQAKKRERDNLLLSLDLKERPDHPFVLFNLGMTDHYGQAHHDAIGWLTRCIEVSGEGESHIRKAYSLMAVSQRELGDLEGALATLESGLSTCGPDPELHFQAGYTLSALGKFPEARAHYEQCLNIDTSGWFTSYDVGIQGYKGLFNLGQVCLQMGDYPAARHAWKTALNASPDFLPVAFELFDAALANQDFATAKEALGGVETVEGLSVNWCTMASRLAEGEQGAGGGLAFLSRLAQSRPDALWVRLVLARQLLEQGNERAAHPHLLHLAELGVAEGAYFLGVIHNRQGQYEGALYWMERALELDASHEPTREQVENLRRMLGREES